MKTSKVELIFQGDVIRLQQWESKIFHQEIDFNFFFSLAIYTAPHLEIVISFSPPSPFNPN